MTKRAENTCAGIGVATLVILFLPADWFGVRLSWPVVLGMIIFIAVMFTLGKVWQGPDVDEEDEE